MPNRTMRITRHNIPDVGRNPRKTLAEDVVRLKIEPKRLAIKVK